MITITLRQRNNTKISVPLDKKVLPRFREAWRLAHQGLGKSLVVYDDTGAELLKIIVPDIQQHYYEMIQVTESA